MIDSTILKLKMIRMCPLVFQHDSWAEAASKTAHPIKLQQSLNLSLHQNPSAPVKEGRRDILHQSATGN